MITKSKKMNLNSIFEFESLQDKYRNDAEVIMFRFLSEVEKLMQVNGMNKKELAHKLGTSPSYITQLFRGDKLVNLITLAKIQNVFNIDFRISSCDKSGIMDISNEEIDIKVI